MSSFELEERLTVLHDDNGTFIDHSDSAYDYTRDDITFDNIAAEDRLLVGFKKPFANLYFEVKTPAVTSVITLNYFNGTSFVAVDKVIDDTNNMQRSGYLRHKREQGDWVNTTIDGKDLYWLELKLSVDETVEFNGINTVFSDDRDLLEEYRNIEQFRNPNDVSFISLHQSARKDIVQKLRNQGHVKRKELNQEGIFVDAQAAQALINITEWDLLEPDEIRRASTFMVLSKIFFNISDQVGDKFEQLSLNYKRKFEGAIETFLLTMDRNDDGLQRDLEKDPIKVSRIDRI